MWRATLAAAPASRCACRSLALATALSGGAAHHAASRHLTAGVCARARQEVAQVVFSWREPKQADDVACERSLCGVAAGGGSGVVPAHESSSERASCAGNHARVHTLASAHSIDPDLCLDPDLDSRRQEAGEVYVVGNAGAEEVAEAAFKGGRGVSQRGEHTGLSRRTLKARARVPCAPRRMVAHFVALRNTMPTTWLVLHSSRHQRSACEPGAVALPVKCVFEKGVIDDSSKAVNA